MNVLPQAVMVPGIVAPTKLNGVDWNVIDARDVWVIDWDEVGVVD